MNLEILRATHANQFRFMFQASRAGHLLSKAPRRAQANFESGASYGKVRNQYQEVHVFQNNANERSWNQQGIEELSI